MPPTALPLPSFPRRLQLAAQNLARWANQGGQFWLSRWLLFCLSSLVVYLFGWVIWSAIQLGVPWFDWQWHGAWVAVGLALAVFAATRWQRWWVWVACLLWLVVGYEGLGQTQTLNPQAHPLPRLGFWTFFDPPMMTDALLHDLHEAGGPLYLTASRATFTPTVAAELRRWGQAGVPVYLALTTDDFLYAGNAADYIALAEEAAAWVTAENLDDVVVGFIGDAEPAMHRGPTFQNPTPAMVEQAVSDLQAFRTRLHTTHPQLQNGMTAGWPWYVDAVDGDADFAYFSGSPVDPPGWDYVNVMAYTSYFTPTARAYSLFLTQETLRHRYPTTPRAFLLGIVGYGMPGEPVLDFDSVVFDTRLSRALGAETVGFFHLNGAVQKLGPDFVRRLLTAAADPTVTTIEVPFSRLGSNLGWLLADASWDLGGWRGAGLGLWAVGWLFWFWRTAARAHSRKV